MGSTYEFHADGSMTVTFGVIADGIYRRQGDRILVESWDGTSECRLEDDALIHVAEPGGTMRFVSDDPASGGDGLIDRRWRAESSALPEPVDKMYQVFTADGKMLMRIPFQTQTGTYSVDGDTLVMEFAGRKSVSEFRIDGVTLVLTSEDAGKTMTLKRPGQWLPGPNEAGRSREEVDARAEQPDPAGL
ncbi:MAG: hypothetical protein GY719_11205 [bacterium]|nr:hypothetical protein [bacterium]